MLAMLFGILAALLVTWAVFVAFLMVASIRTRGRVPSARVLTDTVRLMRRLTTDPALPLPSRLLVWGLLAHLACPVDVVPDFLPLVGYADDAVLTAVVMRHLVRRAGADVVTRHWPGSTDDLRLLCRTLRVPLRA